MSKKLPISVIIARALGWTDVEWYEDNASPGFWHGKPYISEEQVFKLPKHELENLRKYGTKLKDYENDANTRPEMLASLTEEEIEKLIIYKYGKVYWMHEMKSILKMDQPTFAKLFCKVKGLL